MSDEIRLIEVKEDILADNTQIAKQLQENLRKEKTFLLNLMASPGAGKTSLVIQTIRNLKEKLRIGVMEADIDSMVDAEKVAKEGVAAIQIRTGGFCHMDATMVKSGLNAMDTDTLDLVILENVGNLVCPAEFETGAIKNAMILSVPEGDDKPLKYPLMFSVCHVLVINKTDFLELSDFDVEKCRERVLKINPDIRIFEVSCRTGEGIDKWVQWLYEEVKVL
ncbi:MAG: hydrogenase nickel incorporation protein HypB [Desulfobacteraceae bacterium]|nr:hydrogenase nickel incorporation protein HypB [Desulfobacteraceae bacterium]MBC2756645.1 hydrogenase nickel incorporation protein HypB [Desulfobacteraceae bacterium]